MNPFIKNAPPGLISFVELADRYSVDMESDPRTMPPKWVELGRRFDLNPVQYYSAKQPMGWKLGWYLHPKRSEQAYLFSGSYEVPSSVMNVMPFTGGDRLGFDASALCFVNYPGNYLYKKGGVDFGGARIFVKDRLIEGIVQMTPVVDNDLQEILKMRTGRFLLQCKNIYNDSAIQKRFPTIQDLVTATEDEIMSLPKVGRGTLNKIKSQLKKVHPDLYIGMDII